MNSKEQTISILLIILVWAEGLKKITLFISVYGRLDSWLSEARYA